MTERAVWILRLSVERCQLRFWRVKKVHEGGHLRRGTPIENFFFGSISGTESSDRSCEEEPGDIFKNLVV